FDPLVVLFGEHRSDQSDQCSPVGEDPDHIGATPDLLVQPLLYPALRVGSTPDCRFGSAVEPLQVVGQRVSDAMVTGRFIGPSSVAGIDLECLDVGALRLERVAELRSGDEVVAGLADVGIGTSTRALVTGTVA